MALIKAASNGNFSVLQYLLEDASLYKYCRAVEFKKFINECFEWVPKGASNQFLECKIGSTNASHSQMKILFVSRKLITVRRKR